VDGILLVIAAAAMGTDHLLAMGYRRIAIVTGPLTLQNERQRVLGYKQSLKAAGIQPGNSLVWQENLRIDDLAAMCLKRLNDAASRPDAILCTNGPTAIGVLRGIHRSGFEIPGDIGFVTFDELTVDDIFRPAITTILQPAYGIGWRAAEILLDRIANGRADANVLNVRLPATLKIRESSRLRLAEKTKHVTNQ
jgi:LacI family transcriptional regulator